MSRRERVGEILVAVGILAGVGGATIGLMHFFLYRVLAN